MAQKWQIIRDDTQEPRSTVATDIAFFADPVPGDVLMLDLPDSDLEGEFEVLRRFVSANQATLMVKAYNG